MLGAVCFAPPVTFARAMLGLPESPFYGWLVSLWLFTFGLAYLRMAVLNQPDRTMMMVGALGKVQYTVVVAVYGASVGAWLAAASGLPDLVMAAVFTAWLVRG
jgi:hypothetical protein